MSTKAITTRRNAIERGSGNPYADLGRPDSDEMLVKAELAHRIAQIIQDRQLTQLRAAELLGMSQPKLSEMLRGKFRGISQAKMIECLNRLGHDVEIVVKKAGRRSMGNTHVVTA
jgi:predicted XRE-type DNA-binding protein